MLTSDIALGVFTFLQICPQNLFAKLQKIDQYYDNVFYCSKGGSLLTRLATVTFLTRTLFGTFTLKISLTRSSSLPFLSRKWKIHLQLYLEHPVRLYTLYMSHGRYFLRSWCFMTTVRLATFPVGLGCISRSQARLQKRQCSDCWYASWAVDSWSQSALP
jgi:hypothetical protein